MQFAPLAHAHETEEMPRAPVTQLRLRQVLMGLAVIAPQVEHTHEIGFGIGKRRVRRIGLLARIGGALARILNAEERDDGQQITQAVQLLRFHQHTRQLHIDRQLGHRAPDRR